MTRIARIKTATVELPCRFPIESAVRSSSRVVNVLVVVHTDDGLHGSSYVAGFTRHQARAIHAMLNELEHCVTGVSVHDTGVAWQRMNEACRLLGRGGLGTSALAALDVALWDAKAKALGAPLHALLGTAQHHLSAYASDGCWLSEDPMQPAREAAGLVDEGFRSVKVRLGRVDPRHDLKVVDDVRSAVGDEVELLVDANQGWTLSAAWRIGGELADRGITWLEEPLPAEDVRGMAQLQRMLPLRVVAGESVYLPAGIDELVRARAVEVVMPDVQRVGGVTGWIRAGAIAETAGLQLSSHLFPEISVQLLAATPGAGPLEYVSWMQPFVEYPLDVADGTAAVPDRPGLGLEFDWTELKEHLVD